MSDVTPLISPELGLFSDLNINWRETLEIYLFLNTSPGQAQDKQVFGIDFISVSVT